MFFIYRLTIRQERSREIERWNSTQSLNGLNTFNETGDLVGYRGIDTDLTEHRQMEENLRISEERYRLLAEHAGDVIWTMDIDGRFTYISPSVIKMTGYTPEEALQLSWEELLCPDSFSPDMEMMAKNIADIQAGLPIPAYQIELEQRHKDGSTIWILGPNVRPIPSRVHPPMLAENDCVM